jgi:hypothetical protein
MYPHYIHHTFLEQPSINWYDQEQLPKYDLPLGRKYNLTKLYN